MEHPVGFEPTMRELQSRALDQTWLWVHKTGNFPVFFLLRITLITLIPLHNPPLSQRITSLRWCLRSELNGRHLVFQTSALTWLSYTSIIGTSGWIWTTDFHFIRVVLWPTELRKYINGGDSVTRTLDLPVWHLKWGSNSRSTGSP